LGLEGLGKGMDPEVVFRMDVVQKLTGLAPGDRLTADALSALFLDPRGLFKRTPASARKTVFLNKLDLIENEREAETLAQTILERAGGKIDQVVRGSLKTSFYSVIR